MGTTQFVAGHPDQIKGVASLLQVHRHGLACIIDLADGADEQRAWDRNRLFFALGVEPCELIVEAVLSADEWSFPFDR